ncbi:ankyrin repeat domain-containing protein 26-like isoform X2 [Heliangelus exortis]|uniref:ankyrin repeat domain-containing protein 26-like isoform X2 n=1 Tax=Heliangelus exortis TaxID=472823 RepID=UPI003A94CE55
MEEKQQLELRLRNLERIIVTLRNQLKQVEEEHDEIQRQISQEKSPRALQGGILQHHHLQRHKEQEEMRRDIKKNSIVCELFQQLEAEFKKRAQLETENRDLRAELSAMRCKHEQLKKSKSQLKEEVTCLKNCLETNMVDHSRMELCKRDIEERAAQEIRQILQQVNLFLQAQAASQDRIEQIRASHHESLRNQLKERIRHFELELDNMKKTQQDFISLKESLEAEVEKYTQLYLQEMKIRARFANELERTNEEIAEANAKLLQEYDRRISSLRQSIARGHHNERQRRNASRPIGSVEAFVAQPMLILKNHLHKFLPYYLLIQMTRIPFRWQCMSTIMFY